ncbi:MAG: acyl-CoA dehydrogenase [Betaproteobacteria bacterium HGW-Betaproteobacteria-5]|jgi:alkylation response protein AidB-like acyl-CoA dehydrogenase|nr:MAG: acyl-CoA dehydrogenase [Betaproteobacteria bacterium HGW-Betaproteobacteria-5]PKO41146.1 MAG: acyl-CoA dehydrogenase [Betaproteobacteria bacterium HGW-Betaproteobacteria-6]
MKFAFNEEQQMFQDAVRGCLQRDVTFARTRAWAEEGLLGEFDNFSARQGWPGLGIHEDAGGQGGGIVELAIFFEELGRAAAPSGRLLATTGLALPLIFRATGSLQAVADVLENGAGVSVVIPGGRLVDAKCNEVVLREQKLFGAVPLVLDALGSAFLLVPVRTSNGVDLWLVEAEHSGIVISARQLVDHTRRFADVVLDGAVGQRIGSITDDDLQKVAACTALLVAAESLGLARRMLEMTTAYVKERVQFGVPVGSFQAVKHAAAEVLVDIEAAHSGIYYAAWALENAEIHGPLHAWMVKAFATESAARAADRALFLHGAIGYTWEYDLQYLYKRAKTNVELFGSPKAYRERIADSMNLV